MISECFNLLKSGRGILRILEGARKFLTGSEKAASILCGHGQDLNTVLGPGFSCGLVRDHSIVLLLGTALRREGTL